jgi:hypothetical protein
MKQTVIIPSTHWQLSSTNNTYEIKYPFTDLFFEPNKTYNVTLTVISSNVHSSDISDDAHDEGLNDSILPATYKYHLTPSNFSVVQTYMSSYVTRPTNSAISHYSVVETSSAYFSVLPLRSLLLRNSLLAFADNFNSMLQNSDSIVFGTHFAFNPENMDCHPAESEVERVIYQQNFTDSTIDATFGVRQVTFNTKTYRSPRVSLIAYLAPNNQTNFFTALSSEFWRIYDNQANTPANVSTYANAVGGPGGLVIDFVNFYDNETLKVRPALEIMFGYWSTLSQQIDIRKTIWIDDTFATFLYLDGTPNAGGSLGGGSINSNGSASSVNTRMSILSNYATNNDDQIKKTDCYFSISARINQNSLYILLLSTNLTTGQTTTVVEDTHILNQPFFYFCAPNNTAYNLFRYSVGYYPDTFSVNTAPYNALRERLKISNASVNQLISSGIGDMDVRMLYPINIYKTLISKNIDDSNIKNVIHRLIPEVLDEDTGVLNFDMNSDGDVNSPKSITTNQIELVFQYAFSTSNTPLDRAGLFLYDSNGNLIDLDGFFLNCNKSDFTFVNNKPFITDNELQNNPNILQDIVKNNKNEVVFKSIMQNSYRNEVLDFLRGVNNLGYSNGFVASPDLINIPNNIQYAKFVAKFSFSKNINIASIRFKCKLPVATKSAAFPQCFQLNYIPLNSSNNQFVSFIELNNLYGRNHTSDGVGTTAFNFVSPSANPEKYLPLNRFFQLNPTTPLYYSVGAGVGTGLSAVKTIALNIANNAYLENNILKKVGTVSRFATPTIGKPFNNTKMLKYKFTTKNPENFEKLITSIIPNRSKNNAFDDLAVPPNIILEFEPLEPTKRLSGRKRKNFLV